MFPAKSIMSENIVAVKKYDHIIDAMEALVQHKVSGLPVVDNENNLVGILSEWDVLQLLTDADISSDSLVSDFMTKNVISFDEDDSAIEICDFLKNSNKRRAPIVKNGKLSGIISRHDIIKLILSSRRTMSKDQ